MKAEVNIENPHLTIARDQTNVCQVKVRGQPDYLGAIKTVPSKYNNTAWSFQSCFRVSETYL